MANLFEYTSYRLFFKDLCSSSEVKRGFQSQLARAANCQAAYFSQVLKQKVHLTEDQILLIAEYLEFSDPETNFLHLLLRLEKAATEKLRKYLKLEISRAKGSENNLSRRVPADQVLHSEIDLIQYFSSWIPSAVHLLTSSKEFRTPEKIANRLNIPIKDTKEILNFLLKVNWVQKKDQEYIYVGGNIHVAKDSPLQSTMQVTRRHLALNSIALNSCHSMHYSSMFTIDSQSYEQLQNLVGKFVQQTSKVIQAGGTQELYCICVDLFSVP